MRFALLFLYREVLEQPLGGLEAVVRAKRPHRLPVVLTVDFEAHQLVIRGGKGKRTASRRSRGA